MIRYFRRMLSLGPLYVLVLPSLALVVTFAYTPVGSAVYHSFFEWAGGESKRFIGPDNYRRLMTDSVFWSSFIVIGILVAANVVKLMPSVCIAVLIHRLRSDRFQYLYRVMVVVPMLVTLFVWKFFLDPNIGPVNRLLDALGGKWILVQLDQWFGWGVFSMERPIGWLSQPELVVPALVIWGLPWLGSVTVLIYLAGLQNIGREVYEAAELDGVGPWQQFWHIELPLIMTQIRLTLALMIIATLQGFGLQLLLLNENGGPGGRGMVPGLWMYNRAFANGEYGYACALGLVLFTVILTLTWINNRLVRVDK